MGLAPLDTPETVSRLILVLTGARVRHSWRRRLILLAGHRPIGAGPIRSPARDAGRRRGDPGCGTYATAQPGRSRRPDQRPTSRSSPCSSTPTPGCGQSPVPRHRHRNRNRNRAKPHRSDARQTQTARRPRRTHLFDLVSAAVGPLCWRIFRTRATTLAAYINAITRRPAKGNQARCKTLYPAPAAQDADKIVSGPTRASSSTVGDTLAGCRSGVGPRRSTSHHSDHLHPDANQPMRCRYAGRLDLPEVMTRRRFFTIPGWTTRVPRRLPPEALSSV
jgi:hypothetical protein